MGIDTAIQNVVKYFKWTPNIISEMYCDDLDFKGILYWNKVAKEISDNMNLK